MQDYADVHIERTLPREWEEEESFHDQLYGWMSRAPWLLISAAGHLAVFLIIQAIPWNLFEKPREYIIDTGVATKPEEIFEPPPEEELLPVEEPEVDEPVVVNEVDIVEAVTEDNSDFDEGDPLAFADNPAFDATGLNDLIGIGGGAGDKFGGRFGGPGGARRSGSSTERALKEGLDWLQAHQSLDGSWSAGGFDGNCGAIGSGACEGSGNPLHSVGVTSLALLAFLGDGNTLQRGRYRQVVSRAVRWLREQQDFETGLIGEETHHEFLYDHALATLALSEAYYFGKSPMLVATVKRAVAYIHRARNPYSAWRYSVPPVGDNDTSITGWMVFALKSAQDAGIPVDENAFVAALSWIDEVTDQGNGRVGYLEMGGQSSRVQGLNDHFPTEGTEAMTAVALLCRFFLGQTPSEEPIMERHADLLLRSLPEWSSNGDSNDMYYWYYGSYAMYQMGGKYWKAWNEAMRTAILGSQRNDGDARGSWDPNGPWGHAGGRVYSTASMVLCLEVYFRYARVLGAR